MSELLTLKHLKLPTDAGGAQPARSSNDVRNFSMETQEEPEWCWAAVTQSVEGWGGNTVSQPEVASFHVNSGAGLICARPLSPAGSGSRCAGCTADCAEPHRLSVVLDERSRLAAGGAVQILPSFNDIQQAVDAQRPLPVRINWSGGHGHFVCVTGYAIDSAGMQWVTVHDPLLPGVDSGPADNQDLRYSSFATAYPSTNGATGTPNFRYEVK